MTTPVSGDYLTSLVDFHAWAGRRLLDAAAKVPAEELQRESLSHGSVLKTLLHVLDVSYSWRMVAEDIHDGRWVWEVEPLEDLEAVRRFWDAENERLKSFVSRLGADDADRVVEKPNWPGHPFRVWQIVVHIVTHQVEHGNELAWQLTELGQSPGELGFIGFVDRTRGRGG